MFKLENFENELLTEMSRKLSFNQKDNQFSINKLAAAAEHLNVAAEIFEDVGMTKQAEIIISLLEKIAHDHHGPHEHHHEEALGNCYFCGHDMNISDPGCHLSPDNAHHEESELKTASVESLKKIKKDLKDSELSAKELASLKKMIEQMQDSNHAKDKSSSKKLVKNLKETGTLFGKKDYK